MKANKRLKAGIFTVLLLIGFAMNAVAGPDKAFDETKGKVTGEIIDSITNLPVSYATVSIFRNNSPSPFNGVISGDDGTFSLTNVPEGNYRIVIDFIGYRKKSLKNIAVTKAAAEVSLGTILLVPSTTQLKTVEIVSKAPIVENKIDKQVYNVANDLTSQGGSAADVLTKVPQVTVDIDGNVQLQGNANIKFLINGKPSSIFGASLADALQAIPASQIKSIEVITSPGAKYDANGTGGIINIVLKESKIEGVNGSVNLSAGTRRENASLNLNVHKGNFGVNVFFNGGGQINSTTINKTNRLSYNAARDTSNSLSQLGQNSFARGGFQSGINFSWDITPKDQLTIGGGYDFFGNHNFGPTNQSQTAFDVANNSLISDVLSLRNSDSRFSGKYFDYNVSYKKSFQQEGQELNVLFTSSYGDDHASFSQQQSYLSGGYPPSGIKGNNPGQDREIEISVDYTQPIGKKYKIETGVKASIDNINNTVVTDTLAGGNYVPNINQTYGFKYHRKVYAAYVSGTFSLFKDFIEGNAGLRDEYTLTSADFPGTNIPDYNVLAPSIVLLHKLDESQSIKLSYTYRIERPDYGSLNPFYNISDPHNINTGNPNLKPEIGHNYEFGYSKNFAQGANIYAGLYYRYNTNDLQSYTTFYDTLSVNGTTYSNVSLSRRYNIGTETTEGVSLFASVPVTKKFTLRSNLMFSDRITTNPGNPNVSGFIYRLNLNASYEFGQDLTAELFGNYNSSQRTIQGTRPVFAIYNLAVRKQFLKKKLSLGFTAADPFSKYINQTSTTSGPNFSQTNLREVPFRSFGITLSYKFGKLDFKKDKKDDNNNNNAPDNAESGNNSR